MAHVRFNVPIPRTDEEGRVDPDSLRHLIRALNDWSRTLDTQVDSTHDMVEILRVRGGIGT